MHLTLIPFKNWILLQCNLGNNNLFNQFAIYRQLLRRHTLNKLTVNHFHETVIMETNNVFEGSTDRFNGVTVDSNVENCNAEEFDKKLQESLKSWTESNKRGIWFKVALEHSDWVPVLAKNGFNFHHTKSDFLMMYKWLPKNETNNIPPYCHTMLGVGAIVVNDKSEILVVREKYWLVPQWKLPGGYVEPGENLVDAAIREVYEETHISTEFLSLINLRHGHRGMFNTSDLYVVVSLKPLSTQIEICKREISDCRWMDIKEYLNDPKIHDLNKFIVNTYLDYQKNNFKIDCKHGIHQVLKKPYTVYFGTKQV